MKSKTLIIGAAVTVFFSLAYAVGVFGHLGNQVYDFFLRFRAERVRDSGVVFLNVDDNAIAYHGVFPWPRSVTADGILRLKEYGLGALIFDIEFIDRGHQGVDTIHLSRGLPADFDRSFTGINSAVMDVFQAVGAGTMDAAGIGEHALSFSEFISGERDRLFTSVQRVARDNDQYLVQASQLFGRSWVSLNLRAHPLWGEQAERRVIAEEHLSHPVNAAANVQPGIFVDILPPLPGLALSAQGAGFTNIAIDEDGIRRRIFLAQNIHGHWYLQLAFAPLVHYLGTPELELQRRRMILRDARMPDGETRDITIPLDTQGRMMIDWPPQDYFGKFNHVSFAYFALLNQIEADMETYIRALSAADFFFFSQFDPSLDQIPFIIGDLLELYDVIGETRARALEYACGESFDANVHFRRQSRGLIRQILDTGPEARVNALVPELTETFPWAEAQIYDEAAFIAAFSQSLAINLDRYEEIDARMERELRGKFGILGRVDTGTTDIGSNPFWGEYINVGTHGIVLDMILSQTFITPVDEHWRILFTLAFVLLFLLASSKLPPTLRAASGFLAAIFVVVSAILLFRFTGVFFSPLITSFVLVSVVVLREIIAYSVSEREKRFIRKAFSTYVSDEVVKEILADPSRLELGGTNRHMTAVFTDLKGFSTLSEKLAPEALVNILNRYLTAMSDVILSEKGTIDKYIGDAIVAFFGAPVELPGHGLKACHSALTMRRIEKDLSRALMEEKISPTPLLTRIGINTGNMVAGNMGTESKMNYTVMGNAVNLASRLEGANKLYGTWILAPDATIQETGGLLLSRRLDRIRVVGIHEPVQIHELVNTQESATAEERKLVEVFHEALRCYEKRNWKEAEEGFRESLTLEAEGDSPSGVFIGRCREFMASAPGDDWDGVHNLTEK
ncbi:MAG: adenylate/guanylate cyclase domain-containing protein [Treponema sp.]|nr:adenylate/guanylate cyclase domain-containing protein [Treponema sp.]